MQKDKNQNKNEICVWYDYHKYNDEEASQYTTEGESLISFLPSSWYLVILHIYLSKKLGNHFILFCVQIHD